MYYPMTPAYGFLGLIVLVLDMYAIFKVAAGTSPVGRKALWIIMIVVLPVVGMILYFTIGHDSHDREVLT